MVWLCCVSSSIGTRKQGGSVYVKALCNSIAPPVGIGQQLLLIVILCVNHLFFFDGAITCNDEQLMCAALPLAKF